MFIKRSSIMIEAMPEKEKINFVDDNNEVVEFDYDPENFVYFRCRAITADTPNTNGDYFPEEEIKKAYKTFIGIGLYLDHKSDSVEKSIGKVLWAEYIPEGKYVECYCAVDKNLAPEIAYRVKQGIIDSVSMGTSVETAICSYCGNEATNINELCDHMIPGSGYKGRYIDGKLVYEINKGLNFYDLSLVTNPADKTARVFEVHASDKSLSGLINKTADIGNKDYLTGGNFKKVLLNKDKIKKIISENRNIESKASDNALSAIIKIMEFYNPKVIKYYEDNISSKLHSKDLGGIEKTPAYRQYQEKEKKEVISIFENKKVNFNGKELGLTDKDIEDIKKWMMVSGLSGNALFNNYSYLDGFILSEKDFHIEKQDIELLKKMESQGEIIGYPLYKYNREKFDRIITNIKESHPSISSQVDSYVEILVKYDNILEKQKKLEYIDPKTVRAVIDDLNKKYPKLISTKSFKEIEDASNEFIFNEFSKNNKNSFKDELASIGIVNPPNIKNKPIKYEGGGIRIESVLDVLSLDYLGKYYEQMSSLDLARESSLINVENYINEYLADIDPDLIISEKITMTIDELLYKLRLYVPKYYGQNIKITYIIKYLYNEYSFYEFFKFLQDKETDSVCYNYVVGFADSILIKLDSIKKIIKAVLESDLIKLLESKGLTISGANEFIQSIDGEKKKINDYIFSLGGSTDQPFKISGDSFEIKSKFLLSKKISDKLDNIIKSIQDMSKKVIKEKEMESSIEKGRVYDDKSLSNISDKYIGLHSLKDNKTENNSSDTNDDPSKAEKLYDEDIIRDKFVGFIKNKLNINTAFSNIVTGGVWDNIIYEFIKDEYDSPKKYRSFINDLSRFVEIAYDNSIKSEINTFSEYANAVSLFIKNSEFYLEEIGNLFNNYKSSLPKDISEDLNSIRDYISSYNHNANKTNDILNNLNSSNIDKNKVIYIKNFLEYLKNGINNIYDYFNNLHKKIHSIYRYNENIINMYEMKNVGTLNISNRQYKDAIEMKKNIENILEHIKKYVSDKNKIDTDILNKAIEVLEKILVKSESFIEVIKYLPKLKKEISEYFDFLIGKRRVNVVKVDDLVEYGKNEKTSKIFNDKKIIIKTYNNKGLKIRYMPGQSFNSSFIVAREGEETYQVEAYKILPLNFQSAVLSGADNIISSEEFVDMLNNKFSSLKDFKRWVFKRKSRNKKAFKKYVLSKTYSIEDGGIINMSKENIEKGATSEKLQELSKALDEISKVVKDKKVTAAQTEKVEPVVDGKVKTSPAPEPTGAIKEVVKTEQHDGKEAKGMNNNWSVNDKELQSTPKEAKPIQAMPANPSVDAKEVETEALDLKQDKASEKAVKKYYNELGEGATGKVPMSMDVKSNSEIAILKMALEKERAEKEALLRKSEMREISDAIMEVVSTLESKGLIKSESAEKVAEVLSKEFADKKALAGLKALIVHFESKDVEDKKEDKELSKKSASAIPQLFIKEEYKSSDDQVLEWLSKNWNK